ncbi:hypothetical protein [Thaumasiovibrio sp. DFM-14]|uniref:hypothetical protein n=1 Tax=Thaumasiovibrio sp. DFM-14 TaxID=3384792 RepID=UPI00399F8CA6
MTKLFTLLENNKTEIKPTLNPTKFGKVSNSMFDYQLIQVVLTGNNAVEDIAKGFRIDAARLTAMMDHSLFCINDGKVELTEKALLAVSE